MNYIGKEVRLFPSDTYWKNAVIENVDEYGWLFRITACHDRSGYKVGELVFYSFSHPVFFKFL